MLFADVTLYDADARRFVPGQSVYVADGKIAAVGPLAALSLPQGTRTIDGKGKTLVPGLWDSHLHIGDDWDVLANLASGYTSFRSPGTMIDRAKTVVDRRNSGETDEFLEAVNPAAFVISSGDAEGHVHPRPDLLGRLGRKGRGNSPVLLSTELQRSVRDREDMALVDKLKADIDLQVAGPTPARKKAIDEAIRILSHSNVEVDGAIYLKTDGSRLITAFKKEDKSDKDKWFYFEYRIIDGELVLVPR